MKSMKNKSKKVPGKCCDVTYKGLHDWYKSVFEQLGWMVLAKENGMTDKISVYINSIYRIHMAIEQLIKTHPHKKVDLQIMKKNVKILLAHVQKDFHK